MPSLSMIPRNIEIGGWETEEMDKMRSELVPLAFLMPGEKGEIVGFRGGMGLTRRLYEMGFVPSAIVEVLSSYRSGPLLVYINGTTRIAIGRGIGMKIIVRRVEK